MSVAILKEQQIIFKKGFGYADIENQIPATENTPYNIASLTKPFGATILMGLVEEGRLNLDDAMSVLLKDAYFQYRKYSAHGYADLCKKLRKLAWRYGSLWDYRCHTKESKETMYTPTISISGKILPYGLGWFVQVYKGTKIVWHYGHWPKAYSSLILKIPKKELTMILLANSDGASKGFNLGRGNVINSPFALLFINLSNDMT